MNVTVEITRNRVLPDLMKAMGEEGRRDLYATGTNALAESIAAHIRGYASSKHATARKFGAPATGHYTKGAAAISTSASAEGGVVTIPIPGISRAFGDVTITPTRANRLTVPLSSAGPTVYGRTVAELRAMGWKFFRGRKGHEAEDILFGYRGKGKEREVKAMFVLKTVIEQRRDPSLLPSGSEMAKTAANAMLRYVADIVKQARGKRNSA